MLVKFLEDVFIIKKEIKHLPGQHNQLEHGRRFKTPGNETSKVISGPKIKPPKKEPKPKIEKISKTVKPKVEEPTNKDHTTIIGKKLSFDTSSSIEKGSNDINYLTNEKGAHGDDFLYDVMKEQGFDGKPDVVSKEELDKHIADGETEIFRGLNDSNDMNAKYAEQFRSGDVFVGKGGFGGGTYTATSEDIAKGYAGNGSGMVMRMSLKKDAKIISLKDLNKNSDIETNGLFEKYGNTALTPEKERLLGAYCNTALNAGRFAALQGHDAVYIPSTGYYLILNRTAIRVQQQNITYKG